MDSRKWADFVNLAINHLSRLAPYSGFGACSWR